MMSRRNQLRHEAARVRGQIDRRAGRVQQRVEHLMSEARALARGRFALPVAFVCGMLVGRAPVSGIDGIQGFLIRLARQMRALYLASVFIRPAAR